MSDAFTDNLYSEVLQENKLKLPMFNIRKIRQAFLKGVEKKTVVIPEALSIEPSDDEIYTGNKKRILKFILPRGSFGTMFIKRSFSSYCINPHKD